jgi:hypothetical protein
LESEDALVGQYNHEAQKAHPPGRTHARKQAEAYRHFANNYFIPYEQGPYNLVYPGHTFHPTTFLKEGGNVFSHPHDCSNGYTAQTKNGRTCPGGRNTSDS